MVAIEAPGSPGARLKQVRALARLTQRETARLVKTQSFRVSYVYLGQLEREERKRPGAELVMELARVFGLSPEWLMRGTGRAPTERAIKSAVARAMSQAPTESAAAE